MGHSKRGGGQRGDVEDWSLKRQKLKPGVSPRAARADRKMVRERGKDAGQECCV